MSKIRYRLILSLTILGMAYLFVLTEAQAQWPPFKFDVIPTYEDGQATYYIEFRDRVKWQMTNLEIKIPLPPGTRFVEANTIPTLDAKFDGKEVTFFAAVVSKRIKQGDAYFTIEVTDPTIDRLTIQPWISWEGEQPGDYLFEEIGLNITRPPLNWSPPPTPRLQLNATTKIENNVITYVIHPINTKSDRMWDVEINVPIPQGTSFLSAEAPPSFAANFTGQEISFSTIELKPYVLSQPLSFKVSVDSSEAPIITHLWATWKNAGRKVVKRVVAQEETRTGDIIVQPRTTQQVFLDTIEDVPIANYDITNIALQDVILPDDELALKLTLLVAGELGPVGEPLRYRLLVDQDCNSNTGGRKRYTRGIEYEILYKHDSGRAVVNKWDKATNKWNRVQRSTVSNPTNEKRITMWIPYAALDGAKDFCWTAESVYNTALYHPRPPPDRMPDHDYSQLTQYIAGKPIIETQEEAFTSARRSSGAFIKFGDQWQYMPGWSEPSPDWYEINFDDRTWFTGSAAIGYGNRGLTTDLTQINQSAKSGEDLTLIQRVDKQSGMIISVVPSGEEVDSVFIRRAFTVDTASITELKLDIKYQGGFVAYLNGKEVARRGFDNTNQSIAYDSLATNQQDGRSSETFELTDYLDELVNGENVLALQAHRAEDSSTLFIDPKLSWSYNPVDTPIEAIPATNNSDPVVPPLTLSDIEGKLAVPIDNGRAFYDVHIFSMPDGQKIADIANARQPNFRYDGERLLINREGGGIENVYEYNLTNNTERQVSDFPTDWHPFYDVGGNRVVYGNDQLVLGIPIPKIEDGEYKRHNKTGKILYGGIHHPFIFVQCGLIPPHQESDPSCQDVATFGVLVPAGQMGDLHGTHPVWTKDDMIAYKGCNSWSGFASCGIYLVPSSSTRRLSDGFIPRQLTTYSSDTPSDTKGDWIAFTSQRDGDWEAYIMDLNGQNERNLSNSPMSNDGLPTISPDGNWVAFVSNRDNQWAVWVTSIYDEETQKLFDLPKNPPWADGDRIWLNERISWAP